MNEPFFQGHFPGHPIMPGVLQLEAMAQVAGILMRLRSADKPQLAYFMSAEDVKWRRPVMPGDTLAIEVELTKADIIWIINPMLQVEVLEFQVSIWFLVIL
jgi:UDP-3-O-[3-hydroxymyristoyl] N-acetylglucosamine deacetylase/3-hydroxyacyl-[acyl-carrier-protein] dehydratase